MFARAATIAIAFLAPAAAPAAPCSQETLSIQGTPVTIGYCVSGAARTNGTAELIVPVTESYAARGAAVRRVANLHFLAGEGVSRVIESVDLAGVGLAGTLHLTLDYSHGIVRVEGALLTPGAITIK